MDAHPLPSTELTLEPIESALPGDGAVSKANDQPAVDAIAKQDPRPEAADRFQAEAAREYQEGRIDSALWHRASKLGGDDKALVTAAYLRARAKALQLQHKHDDRPPARLSGSGSTTGADAPKRKAEPREDSESEQYADVPPRGMRSKLKYIAAAATVLASVVVAVYVVVAKRESESIQPPMTAAAAPVSSQQPVAKSPSGGANQETPEPSLEGKVMELKKGGNWNVVVLYASEWTRKEPNNAAAWNELSVGYARMLQFSDALDAAKKAVQLAPGDAKLWRNLGQVNVTVDHLPEAAIAFDKALAVSSDDVDALCGAAGVAQRQGRPQDAAALASRAKALGDGCAATSDGERAVVVAGAAAPRKPPASVSR